MVIITQLFDHLFGHPLFLLCIQFIALFIKIFLASQLFIFKKHSNSIKQLLFLLTIILAGEISNDVAWILRVFRGHYASDFPIQIVFFFIRIAWGLFILQYLALGLFVERLANKNKLNLVNFIFIIISSISACCYFALAIFGFDTNTNEARPVLEFVGMKLAHFYMFIVLVPSAYHAYKAIRSQKFPKILKQQLTTFLLYLVIPKLFFEFIENNPLILFFPFFQITIVPGNYASIAISTILMTYAIYFSARRMMGLRFLNLNKQVEASHRFNFVDDFKHVLEQLSQVTSVAELKHIIQAFYKEAFGVPSEKATLYIRALEETDEYTVQHTDHDTRVTTLVENFIAQPRNAAILAELQQSKIFIRDEIEFTNFYETYEQNNTILAFLSSINADIFLPIYDRGIIIGYITLEYNARPRKLFHAQERDEMVIFGRYLGNIINLLRHHNLDALILQEKNLKEELYHKHQEINQYKESIRSFLRTSQERQIGIVFYKNRKFVLGNEAAHNLLGIDPNVDEGHPLTRTLKKLVHNVKEYNTSQTVITQDLADERLVLAAIPSLDHHSVIVTIFYPDIADVIKQQFDLLKDPSQWDYLLYLETTHSGQLINNLIPGSGETLLACKINLLKIALNRKATLLHMAEEDCLPTVEIIHHISLRQNLQILKLTTPEKNNEVAIKLFGLNPLLSSATKADSLLENLNGSGTLYVENIHLLSLETQQLLAQFLRYGFFHVLKSERRIASSVRIICSIPKQASQLVEQGLLSITLYNELQPMTLTIPSLLTLPEEELVNLTERCVQQATQASKTSPLLSLSPKDTQHIIEQRPTSIQELKENIQQALIQKKAAHKSNNDIEFDPAFTLSDPELITAVRLGKHALRDKHVMTFLWDKFKNQTKIATLLRVNRSSVNRRCKEYKLIAEHEP